MVTDARLSPAAPAPGDAAALLRVLSGILTRFARTRLVGDELPAALDAIRGAVDAEECALWLTGPHGLMRAGVSRAPGTPARTSGERATMTQEVEAVMSGGPAPDMLVARMHDGGREIGVLGVRATRPLSADERVLLDAAANVLGPSLAHAEYSARLEVEVALRTRQIDEQRVFIERVVDSLPLGLYVIDREYRIQAWNRKRETGMQGVSREEAIGRTIFEILHRQPADVLRAEFDEVFQSGRMQQFQMESRATGETRTYRLSKIPMRLGDGTVTHVVTIGEDVTEWKAALDGVAQAEKLAAIGTLAAGVMHEINNPMATIAACAESLQLKLDDLSAVGVPIPPESGEYLRIVEGEVHRCKRIIDGLLDFSRPKAHDKELVDVNDVIEQTLFLLKHHDRFKRMQVKPLLDRALPGRAWGNPEQLIQVFMALLINAMDAMADHGTITIRTRAGARPSEGLVAEVTDDGHGIPRAELSKIFEPFYTTKAVGRGTGLGLAICYGIVADHGGRLEVESVPGQGSTFRVVLPDAVA